MLNQNDIVKNIDEYIKKLNTRGSDYSKSLHIIKKYILNKNKILFDNEKLKNDRNIKSKEIGKLINDKEKNKKLILDIKNKIKELKNTIDKNDKKIIELNNKIKEILLNIPNLPNNKCPVGKDENDNIEIKRWGKINNNKKPHWEIGKELEIIDFDNVVNISGSRFIGYKNKGALLKRALINFILDIHNNNKYIEYDMPVLVKEENMYGTGQFPKFKDDAYFTKEGLILIPTAEVSLMNIHRNKIIDIEKTPLSYCSYSLCFRKEAGSAGKDTKGIIRLHQFNKIELVKFSNADDSYKNLDILLSNVEEVLKKLNISYRIIDLCTGDLGFSAARTYDIEAWMPHRKKYVEISSCSNTEDFQSRRMNIKYINKKNKKIFAHTINGSGVAIDRLIAIFLETYWNEKEKSIKIPIILQKYMRNIKIIK